MLYHAPFVVPVDGRIIRDGAVLVAGRRIKDVGTFAQLKFRYPDAQVTRLSNQAILPGFVNSHTHLELSSLAGKIRPGTPFIPWLHEIIRLRQDQTEEQRVESVHSGLIALIQHGTTTLADISPGGLSADLIRSSKIGGIVFVETLGFNPDAAAPAEARLSQALSRIKPTNHLKPGISPHAPYSVSAALYQAACVMAQENRWHWTTHLAETAAEAEFLNYGSGEFRELLIERRAWNPDWRPPGCSPVKYLARMGILNPSLLAVHLNHLEPGDLELLAESGVQAVVCPGSNRWFGRRNVWLKQMLDCGINVCLGTDSLSSNYSLNMLEELRYVWQEYPELAPERIIAMATLNGARALGLGAQVGSIEPGKRADLVGLVVPAEISAEEICRYIVQNVPQTATVIAGGRVVKQA